MIRRLLIPAVLLLTTLQTRAADWPQFLGPARNATAPDRLADRWPAAGPPVLWNVEVGSGWAGPVVAGDAVVIFHRKGDDDLVQRLERRTGRVVWTFRYPSHYVDAFGFDNGPRSTPLIDNDRLYTLGAGGMLHCLDLATGKPRWSLDTRTELRSDKGFFGRACSPLIAGDLLVLQLGGRDHAGVVAFDKLTGKLRWKTTDDEAGYSSPILAHLAGSPRIAAFTREGLRLLDPATGRPVYSRHWRSDMEASVNAAAPVVVGETLLLSAAYDTGAIALRFDHAVDTPRELWSGDDALSSHYATPVVHGGFVYGFHGRIDVAPGPVLRCVELATGKVRWSADPIGGGNVLLAGSDLLILTERGELILAPASPEGFKPRARAAVLGPELRAIPALADGVLYARDKRRLAALDLR